MSQSPNPLIDAYNRMLQRVHQRLGEPEPLLAEAIEDAIEKASELRELGREEAERIGDYLQRDLRDAAHFIHDESRELKDWLRFDVAVIERGLFDLFAEVVDQTRVEHTRLAIEAQLYGEWHSGEITGIGTLECKGCGELIHFHHTGHIPPCPQCRGSRFRRRLSE
jgi:hypothetical protein